MKIKINKKLIIILTLVFVLTPLTARAQAAGGGLPVLDNLQKVLTLFLQLLQAILWPILLMIGGLLGNDLLFSAGMEERLLSIWVQIRNFVNIGFVVMLVGIALYNVTGIVTREDLMLKTILPKFVIALVLVNFSFIGMKLVLDTTNVLTNAIFAMPAGIEDSLQGAAVFDLSQGIDPDDDAGAQAYVEGLTAGQQGIMQGVCSGIYGEPEGFLKRQTDGGEPGSQETAFCKVEAGKYRFTARGVNYFAQYGSRNAAMVIAIQLMNIVEVDKVYGDVRLDNVGELAFNTIFSVVLYVLYGAAYIALLAILVVRLVVLWIAIALSPLIVLTLVFKGAQGGMGQFREKIINYILAPIYIGIPLTIGYMMLSAYRGFDAGSVDVRVTEFAQLTSELHLRTSGISTLQQMVIAFAAVAVIWVGVFSVAAQKFAVGQWIAGGLKRMGRAAGQIVRYAPVLPIGGEKKPLEAFNVLTKAERIAGEFRGKFTGEGNWRQARTAKEFLGGVQPGRAVAQQREYAETIGRNERLKRELLRPPRLYRELGAQNPEQALERLQKGEVTAPQMKRWLERASKKYGVPLRTETGAGTGARTGAGGTPPAGTQRPGTRGAAAGATGAAAGSAGAGAESDEVSRVAQDIGTFEILSDVEKAAVNKGNQDSAAYKRIRASVQPTTEIETIRNMAALPRSSDNDKALGEALKEYHDKIEKDPNINDDQAKAFTDAVLKKSVGDEDYEQVKNALSEAGYNDLFG